MGRRKAMPDTFKEGDTRLGSFYPKNCVVALMPGLDVARRASDELHARGWGADDVKVWGRNEILQDEQAFTDDRNALQKFGALHSDEEKWMEEYRELMAEGASLLTVYTPDADRLDEVRDILAPLGATKMRHYGALVVSDIVPGAATQ
jgi:hypothetical protein